MINRARWVGMMLAANRTNYDGHSHDERTADSDESDDMFKTIDGLLGRLTVFTHTHTDTRTHSHTHTHPAHTDAQWDEGGA